MFQFLCVVTVQQLLLTLQLVRFSFFVLLPSHHNHYNDNNGGFSFFVLLHGYTFYPNWAIPVLVSLCCYPTQSPTPTPTTTCFSFFVLLLVRYPALKGEVFRFSFFVLLLPNNIADITFIFRFSFFVLLQPNLYLNSNSNKVLVSLCCY